MVPFSMLHLFSVSICNHSATICRRLSPTLKSTGWVTGAKSVEEGDDRCKPNFNRICDRHGAVVCRRQYLLPFEHNARTTDRQTDHGTVTWWVCDVAYLTYICSLDVWGMVDSASIDWMIEQDLTSPSTQYRHTPCSKKGSHQTFCSNLLKVWWKILRSFVGNIYPLFSSGRILKIG